MRYQVRLGDNPLGLNVVFSSPRMQDRVICLSQGAEIISYKQTLQEHAVVYNRGPAGGEWRVGMHGMIQDTGQQKYRSDVSALSILF